MLLEAGRKHAIDNSYVGHLKAQPPGRQRQPLLLNTMRNTHMLAAFDLYHFAKAS